MTELIVSKLKNLVAEHDIALYLIPTQDRYLGEMSPEYYNRLKFVTGLDSSNALLAIGKKSALFTDGRYITQAREELSFLPLEIIDMSEMPFHMWCKKNLSSNDNIGFDPELFSIKYIEKLQQNLESFCTLKPITPNLVDLLWKNDKKFEIQTIYDHPIEFAGQEAKEKIANLNKELLSTNSSHLIICDLTTICWLLNIRGNYLPYTPLVAGYLIYDIKNDDISLFIDNEVNNESTKSLINIYPMSEFKNYVANLTNASFCFDEKVTPYYVKRLIDNQKYQHLDNPCIKNMSVKNPVEVDAAIKSHIYDAVAMCKFLCWLDNNKNLEKLSERDICEKLWEFRKSNSCISPSFSTIAGFNSNGAMIHYKPESVKVDTYIEGDGILLLDSGGQYKEGGTTDVTRTIAIGNPTLEQKEIYTAVLKGHIALARAKFPVGTTGHQLDVLARKSIWKMGLNYGHGTGHGVGSFSSVHEGLQTISTYPNPQVLLANMLITNEPGCYLPGKFGIRIENILLVEEASHNNFLRFRTLTLVPYDQRLIDFAAFDDEEISWINSYHQQICDIILPLLDSAEEKAWLEKATETYV